MLISTNNYTKMDVVTSAEKLTKLLRAKNATPQSVALVGSDLLQGRIPVYLPNAGLFVFNLICDRMNDFNGKDFKTWKYSPELWKLWYTCWHSLDSTSLNKQLRSKAFTNVKILHIVADVLQKVYEDSCKDDCTSKSNSGNGIMTANGSNVTHMLLPDGLKLVSSMFISLNQFMETGYILVDESSAMLLLQHYTKFLLLLLEANSEMDSWTDFVSTIYNMPQQSLTFKLSKKSIAKYYSEVLPYKLNLLKQKPRLILERTYDFLYSTFCTLLFEGESSSFTSQVKSHNSLMELLSDSQIEFLFSESLNRLAPNDIADCEAIYSGLTKNKLKELCTTMLTMLSKLNRTLSPQFCKDIYAKELKSKPTNWLLIGQLLSIDTDLAVNKWSQVINSAYSSDEFHSIAQNIVLGFVRAREYHVFLSEVYPAALEKSSAWNTREVFDTLSQHVADMSRIQINTLAKEFIKKKQIMPLLVLTYGLLSCNTQLQDFNADVFTDSSIVVMDNSELFYYIYCLYGKQSFEKKLFFRVPDKATSFYDLCLRFRMVELSGSFEDLNEENLIHSIKQLKESETKQLLTRWIVLLERLPTLHQAIFDQLFSFSEGFVIEYFKENAVIVFELPQFLRSLQSYISSNEVPSFQKAILTFPSIVFRTYFDEHLRALCEKLRKSPNDLSALQALSHVLQEPRHSLDLETQEDVILSLARSSNNDSLKIIVQITKNVWNMHLKNRKHKDSMVFMSAFVSKLSKNLSKPTQGDLELAKCILSQESTMTIKDADKLMEKLVKVIKNTIKKETLQDSIDTLSDLPASSESTRKAILSILKKYGSQERSPETVVKLFDLATKSYGPSQVTYIVSLFVALRQQVSEEYHDAIILSLKTYTDSVPESSLEQAHEHVLRSFEDAPEPYLCPLLDALALMTPVLNKSLPDEKTITATLLAFATHSSSCLNSATLLRILNLVSRMLNISMSLNQYSIELVLEICNSSAAHFHGLNGEQIFTSAVYTLSCVLLNQRHRLSSRYHLVICIITRFMEALCQDGPLSKSAAAASAFLRMLVTLCEPQVYSNVHDTTQLTSRSAIFKDAFRKEAHILLANFVSLHLLKPFTGEVYDKVISAIHSLCGLLTTNEIQLVTRLLDSLSRVYLQSLYSTFRETKRSSA